jgi:uncharacterized metal-binding protein YceD (DUF177 family)
MKALKAYTITFSGLELGAHDFEYQLDRAFFEHFEFTEIEAGTLSATVHMEKKTNRLELLFSISGTVTVRCDVSDQPFEMPLQNQLELIVKFGDAYDDSNEDLLILPHGEYEINVAQYLYEAVVLGLPLKKVNPKLEETPEGQAMLKQLEAYSPESEKTNKDEEQEADPRWNKLKDLLN